MIYLYTGKTGSGKTLAMTRAIFKRWKKGIDIYTNYPLFFKKYVSLKKENSCGKIKIFRYLSEIINVSNCCVVMDEAQVLADARQWESLPQEFLYKVAQHRKHRIDLYCTTQDVSQIDVRIRLLIQEWVICQPIITIKKWLLPIDTMPTIFHFFKRSYVDTDSFRARNPDESLVDIKKVRWSIFFNKFFWFINSNKLYNTYNDIGFEPYQIICSINENNKPTVQILPSSAELQKIKASPGKRTATAWKKK